MNYEFIVPGERMPYREYVWRKPIMRPVSPYIESDPFSPEGVRQRYERVIMGLPEFPQPVPLPVEELSRVNVTWRHDTKAVEVCLIPGEYTLAREPRVILRGVSVAPLERWEAVEILSMALSTRNTTSTSGEKR